MKSWLNRTRAFLSHDRQKEILEILGNNVVRDIVQDDHDNSKQFGIVVDGSQDCSGVKEESLFKICEQGANI